MAGLKNVSSDEITEVKLYATSQITFKCGRLHSGASGEVAVVKEINKLKKKRRRQKMGTIFKLIK